MEKIATFTKRQNSLIAAAVVDSCDKIYQMASDFKKAGDIANANKCKDDALLLRDAYCKLLRYEEWKMEDAK